MFGGSEHFGLDLGSNSIRIVQLTNLSQKPKLRSFGSAPIPPGNSSSFSKVDIESMANAISSLKGRLGINTKNVVVAIPGISAFTVTTEMPLMPIKDLQKAIYFQAEQSLPINLNEVNFDYHVVKELPENNTMRVMIIAAPKTRINQVVEILSFAGLNLLAVETSAVATSRSLYEPSEPVSLVLDIGLETTEIAIIENGALGLTRSLPTAGITITRAISNAMGIEQMQAEQFKFRFGLLKDKLEGRVSAAAEPVIKEILDEARRSIDFFAEQSGRRVSCVILSGGGSRMPSLSQYINTSLGLKVFFGNPWKGILHENHTSDAIINAAPEFAVSVGLALRR